MAGILDSLLGGLGLSAKSVIKPSSGGIADLPGFRASVSVADGDAAYDTAAEVIALITGVAHTDFFKIWQKTVPAQQTYRWGYGSAALQMNQGFMWFASLDSGTDWDVGTLRLVQAKAREGVSILVAELPDRSLHTTTVTTLATATPTDKMTMVPLPEKVEYPQIGEDSKLQLWYALATAATAHDNAGFEIPVTIRQ